MKNYNYINKSNNQIKKSNSFSSIKKDNNYNLNLTFTEFPKNNNFLINQSFINNNKKFNSTLTEWRNNPIKINNNNTNEKNNNIKSQQITLNGKNHFISSVPNLNNNNYSIEKNTKQKSLILDLDETLVHSSFYPFERVSDLTLPITVDNQKKIVYILRRPYAIEFMKEMASYYEIIIYTASISQYASNLLDELDKYNVISKRYYRNNCIFNNGIYIKDLRVIGKPFKDLIIIDNNPISYLYNINNGLPILSWYGDSKDIELLKLIPLLKYLANVEDVTNIIPKIVNRDKNKIKFSLINKMINNKNSNLNINNINSNFGGNIKRQNFINIHNNYENNINNNNDNNDNNRNDSKNYYLNYINNIPSSNSLDKYNRKQIVNNKDLEKLNNNNYNLNKNNINYENYTNRNCNESSELRDSVFSPEEPNLKLNNLNNINYYEKELQKNTENNEFNKNNIFDKINNEYRKTDNEYLNRTPITEKKNNRSYTPDLEIPRNKIISYQTKEKVNGLCKIERNTINPINNQIMQQNNNFRCNCNKNKNNKNGNYTYNNNNNNCRTKLNNQSNNSIGINNNIMKYFIPVPKFTKNNNINNNQKYVNKSNINISFDNNNKSFDNNKRFDNNNIKVIKQNKIKDIKDTKDINDFNYNKNEQYYNNYKYKENGDYHKNDMNNKNELLNQTRNILTNNCERDININLDNYKNYKNIIDLGSGFKNFDDTAGALANIDLLITVDTSVAHLAGALGVKTFMLLPYCPDWRWFDNDNKTEWYDSIKIFKQSNPKTWDDVIENLKKEVIGLVTEN